MNQKLQTDTPYIHNKTLPIWVVPISGWGSESVAEANNRMHAYKKSAEVLKINIEFTSRLGTFQSYKNAPTVATEIREQNEKTFAVYASEIGVDWREIFSAEVKRELRK